MRIFTLTFVIFLSACGLAPKKKGSGFDIHLSAVWVQDTLAKPNLGFRKVNRMSPLLYKDQIIVGNAQDGLVSYRLSSKNEVWRLNIPYGVEASGTLIKDRLFVGSNSGKMYSIDLTSGQILWSFDTKSEMVAEPLLIDGVLFFLSGSQSVFAVDASNGKQLWTYNRQDTSNLMTVRGGTKPAYSNGIIYVGFSDGSVVSLNAKTGTQQWEIILNRNARFKDIDASPLIDGDFLYINSYDDQLYCLAKTKGEIIWKAPYGGASTPIILGDKIINTSSRGELVTLAKRDGSLIWKNKTSNGIYVDPNSYKGLILTAETQGSLLLFDSLTGERKASFEPGRGVFSKPTVQPEDNMIYFISGEGNIYGFKVEKPKSFLLYYLK
jgi:outer membrane protein assembly factor BamB